MLAEPINSSQCWQRKHR